jgi:hypothetical protein
MLFFGGRTADGTPNQWHSCLLCVGGKREKVRVSPNPAPATKKQQQYQMHKRRPPGRFFHKRKTSQRHVNV